ICNKYGVKIIEDSCEALGSEYKGKKAGAFGIAGAFAFYANKQITTGEGGIIVTNDEDIYKISKSLRNQGRGEGESWLAHEYVGYNYRIDEMSAALGWSQMKRIDDIIGKRDKVAQRYNHLLSNLGVKTPVVKDYVTKMSWFVYVIQLPESVNRQKRKKIMEYLENNGVQVRNYFEPVHLQKPYRELGWKEGMLPITESVAERTLALPFYTDLIQEDQEYVVEKLKEALEIFA
ncbi:MAG TPA: DegT/DnrJ/EryC1/StrS family aminotransferase, partial [Fervidobacterium nodosum]|nr:DegT/DnrJ/EryC1/StrS family aminotransferase [Fervidobacterium nodosum]